MNNERLNGSHRPDNPPPEYYEWWYFHFIAPGLSGDVVVHETDILGTSHDQYISLCFRPDNEPTRYFRRPLSKDSISTSGPYLQTETGEARESKTEIALNLEVGPVCLTGKITKPEFSVPFSPLLCSDGEHQSFWHPQIPHGLIDAALVENGVPVPIKGFAYHDHQWGTLPLTRFVRNWNWGHMGSNNQGLIYARIETTLGETINRWQKVDAGGLTGDTDLYIDESEDGYIPVRLNETASLLLSEQSRQTPIRFWSREANGKQVNYCRWLTTGLLGVNYTENVTGITEQLNIT